MISLTINDKPVQIEKDKTVLDAIRKSGISVPTLCYHKDLTGYGSCRLCQVEITQKNKTKLVVSCLYPVAEGLVVQTHTPRVEKNRKLLVELLLARSPDSKVLQKIAEEYKIVKTRFRLKTEKCILCGLCVRVCSEILGVNAISFANRGTSRKVEVPFKETPEDCLGCGACTYVCPTGAIQMETEARKRWAFYLASGDRECRYSRMGLVSHKVCPNAFQCQRCEVDQRLEDTFGIHPAFIAKPADQQKNIQVSQFQIMPNMFYTAGHIWLKPLNGKFRVGIDDFSAKFLGKVDNIRVTNTFKMGVPVWQLGVGARKLDMYMPFEGRVVEMNPLVKAIPHLIARDPYQQGWIFTVVAQDRVAALESLFSPLTATKIVEAHLRKLRKQSDKVAGVTLLDDAGNLASNIPSLLKDEDWNTLTSEFFKPNSSCV